MAKDDSKKNMYEHSEVKIRLLKEYIECYLSIISNNSWTKKINLFDLFCGPGIYENGGKGSPLIMLDAINYLNQTKPAKQEKLIPMDCYFNDQNSKKIKLLKATVAEQRFDNSLGQINYSSEAYKDKVAELINDLPHYKIRSHKAFVFIDPYGYTGINATQIKGLLQSGNAEVLLWLPLQFMYRFSNKGTPVALQDFMQDIIPDFANSSWSTVFDFIKSIKDGFQTYLGQNNFIDFFTIKKDANTAYCLFFFTTHIKGFEKMLTAKWKIDEVEGFGWSYERQGGGLFQGAQTKILEEKLQDFMQERKTVAAIYEFVLLNGFLTKHVNNIFKVWQKAGQLDVWDNSENKFVCKKGAFHIRYETYKKEPCRYIFHKK